MLYFIYLLLLCEMYKRNRDPIWKLTNISVSLHHVHVVLLIMDLALNNITFLLVFDII